MKQTVHCPNCGHPVYQYRNPRPTVDIIIRVGEEIVMIKRKNYPPGWALPGGFIDYGETVEEAALREAKEETSLDVTGLKQFRVYSAVDRDPRHHTMTVVLSGKGSGQPRAADDAAEVGLFSPDALPSPVAFDHADIIRDFFDSEKH